VTNGSFLIKIIPPEGYNVYRLHVSRAAVAGAFAAIVLLVLGGLGIHAWQLHIAEENVRVLQAQASVQAAKLGEIDRQADALATQLRLLQAQSAEIRRLLGHGAPAPVKPDATHADLPEGPTAPTFSGVKARLAAVLQASQLVALDERGLARLTHRVLNLRRLAEIARVRMLAAIPSINPVGGGIASGYGYRIDPWPEFHQGVDLEADYGAPVHAAADGIVASSGWDGGFGNKVDIDHGNGYHTWYCHLSRADVEVGEYVRKAQHIAQSGSTGESTGPHLHYQIMLDGHAVDPAPYLRGVPPKVLAALK
jgi:murein DD-endopeptidase MepM/ murein hydrolase activator NlpD